MRLVLASTSVYRRELLARLGIPFATEAPGVDEHAPALAALAPEALAAELARQKALAVAARHPDAVVIGSDQIAVLDGERLGKPGTAARAAAQLTKLQGRAHRLVTAVAVTGPGSGTVREFVDVTTLHMRTLGADEIARYVALDQPLDCAGSYRIERAGIALFERIDCADHTAIVGLPLLALSAALRGIGFRLP